MNRHGVHVKDSCSAFHLQVSPAGHCPHDEAAEAVHWCLQDWIASVEESKPLLLNIGEETVVHCQVGCLVGLDLYLRHWHCRLHNVR
jgi:hypothetical protein